MLDVHHEFPDDPGFWFEQRFSNKHFYLVDPLMEEIQEPLDEELEPILFAIKNRLREPRQ